MYRLWGEHCRTHRVWLTWHVIFDKWSITAILALFIIGLDYWYSYQSILTYHLYSNTSLALFRTPPRIEPRGSVNIYIIMHWAKWALFNTALVCKCLEIFQPPGRNEINTVYDLHCDNSFLLIYCYQFIFTLTLIMLKSYNYHI